MGDAQNNVANSLMVVCSKLGLHFVACGPKEQMPKEELVTTCREIAAETGGSVTLTDDVAEACTGRTSSIPTSGCPWASPLSFGPNASDSSSRIA